MIDQEFELDIRRRINPIYKDVIGTESYERAILIGEIDTLRMHISELEKYGSRGRRVDVLTECIVALVKYFNDANAEVIRLRAAIRKTLDENLHLADGVDCTLIELKRALPDWEVTD